VKFARDLGLSTSRLHGLRHTHATHLLQLNISAKIVSERLGHSSIAITLDTYSHVQPGMQEDAVAKYETLMLAAMGKQKTRD